MDGPRSHPSYRVPCGPRSASRGACVSLAAVRRARGPKRRPASRPRGRAFAGATRSVTHPTGEPSGGLPCSPPPPPWPASSPRAPSPPPAPGEGLPARSNVVFCYTSFKASGRGEAGRPGRLPRGAAAATRAPPASSRGDRSPPPACGGDPRPGPTRSAPR